MFRGAARPAGLPRNLLSCSIPFVAASSGSIGNNGALTGITAVSAIFPSAYVYLPANAIAAGVAAGWYYAVFSSTTAATVYNNTYTGGQPTIPASPTAFATTGPGAYTADHSGGTECITFTLPANSMGNNGRLVFDTSCTQTNNANNKSIHIRVGDTTAVKPQLSSASFNNSISTIANRGAVNRQTCFSQGVGTTTYSVAPIVKSYNFAASQTIKLMIQSEAATDTVVLESASISLLP